MHSTLRTQFVKGAVVALVLGVLSHGLAAWLTYHGMPMLSDSSMMGSSFATTYAIVGIFSALGTFFVGVAVVLAAGVVALLVVQEAQRRAEPGTAEPGSGSE